MKYDVIIVGASFAGLAVASRLNAKVLLIDQYDIGSHQISACGTLVKTIEKIGCEDSILQSFTTIAMHVSDKVTNIPLTDPFCTIDYRKFCELFFTQNNAEFIKTSATGVRGNIVQTNIGDFEGDLIVDATGWQAILASSLKKDYVNIRMLSCGIETEVEYSDNKLRFFLDKNVYKNGVAWLFTAGNKSRFGVASYNKDASLREKLYNFVENKYKLKVDKIHGGCFCFCYKNPIVEDIFVVGCAAGQTLALTGEGIRRSINLGLYCGNLIQKVVEGKLTKNRALKEYDVFATKTKNKYNFLLKLQNKLPLLSNGQMNLVVKPLGFKPISNFAWRWYEKI